jgi:hypothetical protein
LFQTLGIVLGSDLEDEEEARRIVDLRGPDPVRPTPEACDALAGRLAKKVCWLSPRNMSKTLLRKKRKACSKTALTGETGFHCEFVHLWDANR